MSAMVRFTAEEIQRLEEKSIKNMLFYFADEMRLIAKGESPTIHLTTPLIRRFIEMGILVSTREGKRRRFTLSRRAREIYGLPKRDTV